MVHVPGVERCSGVHTTAMAELVDVYPTLAELAGRCFAVTLCKTHSRMPTRQTAMSTTQCYIQEGLRGAASVAGIFCALWKFVARLYSSLVIVTPFSAWNPGFVLSSKPGGYCNLEEPYFQIPSMLLFPFSIVDTAKKICDMMHLHIQICF